MLTIMDTVSEQSLPEHPHGVFVELMAERRQLVARIAALELENETLRAENDALRSREKARWGEIFDDPTS